MKKAVFLIFLVAVVVRLLYFPGNVYFAFDQARDSYTALEILKGDFKILGPPSAASEKLFAGPLIYYFYAPIYFLFDKSPQGPAAFLRIWNTLGVFLVFLSAKALFDKKVALLAAFLFALSYVESQYSLFLSHQGLATIPVLLFYLGLALLIFKKDRRGLILAAAGWGLAVQFHYVYLMLGAVFGLLLILFRQQIIKIRPKFIFVSALAFLATVSTYLVTEFKFGLRMLSEFASQPAKTTLHPQETLAVANRFLHDNLLADYRFLLLVWILLLAAVFYLFSQKKLRPKVFFLGAWFLGGLIPYLLSGTPSYYYAAAAGVSLLVLVSFFVWQIWSKNQLVALALVALVLASNLYQIATINPRGPNPNFIIQPGMLLSDQKRALDYIYQTAGNEQFSVSGLTIPLYVNTTWSYLFEWYGKEKYGRLPTWGGQTAEGFPGNLKVETDRAALPQAQFLIIEPTVGIREAIQENFFKEESYFTRVLEEKKFGTITVQHRQKI